MGQRVEGFMVQRSRIEDQAPQETGGGASAQPLQDAVGVLRADQNDGEGLEWLGHACAAYGKQTGHAGGQGAAGTAVVGVEVRRFTADRTPFDRFVRERAVSTGCFEREEAAVAHLTALRPALERAGVKARIGFLTSVLRSDKAFETIASQVSPFVLRLTAERRL